MFSTTTPLILRRKAITKPKAKRQKRQRTSSEPSQSEADNSDSIPIPLEALSVNEPDVAHQKSEEFFVQSTIFQSNSWSERNESIRNKSITRRNQFLTRRRTKQSTVKRNTTVSSGHSSVRYGDRVGLDPSVWRIKDVVDPPIVPGGGASTSDDSEGRKVLVIENEGEAQTRFQLGNCIGRSPRASVYRAINRNTMQMVAVKQIQLEDLKTEEITQLVHEVDLVKRLSHPNIIKYEGMVMDSLRNTLSMVVEYAQNGSLERILEEFGKLNDEKLVANYVIQVLEGLDYLHHNSLVHGNLKAANILMTQSGEVKLSDFGISLYMREIEHVDKGVSCVPNWAAPEVIELSPVSTKSDIWSLGCTVIELLTGRPPYGDLVNALNVMFRIIENDGPPIPEGLSDLLVAFLKECFHKTPVQRPSANELSQHEWLIWALNKDLQSQSDAPQTHMLENTDQRKTTSATNTATTTTTITTTTTRTIPHNGLCVLSVESLRKFCRQSSSGEATGGRSTESIEPLSGG
ncbi:kinase-like domain-containing protein [Russula aff. rugulosa BPL654]|nr:kinase-like domain-containing protein [Russula aff. rugulosa BPL654]